MKYILRKDILEFTPEVEISESEYLELKKARNTLSSALAIEEIYEIFISNYLDFEKEILNITANGMIRKDLDYSDFFKVRLGLNIRLVNFLTAARLYIDQLSQNVSECIADITDTKDEVKGLFSKEFEENKNYKFMEELRNYVQHRGMPVHLIQQTMKRTSLDSDGLIEFSMELYSQRTYLEEDKKIKKRVLAEMEEKVNLKVTTRSYVESISSVHDSVRNMISEPTNCSRTLIENAHRRYAEVYSENLVGLSAYELVDHKQISSIPLILDWDDVRVSLQERNKKLTNLSKCYLTGAIKDS